MCVLPVRIGLSVFPLSFSFPSFHLFLLLFSLLSYMYACGGLLCLVSYMAGVMFFFFFVPYLLPDTSGSFSVLLGIVPVTKHFFGWGGKLILRVMLPYSSERLRTSDE